ncbi:MAG: TolC family protein [Terriglobia bacterium]
MNRISYPVITVLTLLAAFAALPRLLAQESAASENAFDQTVSRNYTNTRQFPDIFGPYLNPRVPPFQLANSALLDELIQNGKMRLSLQDAIALAIENNLNIAVARYNPQYAQADRVRAASGQATRGIQGAFTSSALFSGALGGGISTVTSSNASQAAGSATGGGNGIFNVGPIGSFDPVVGFDAGIGRHVAPLSTATVFGIPVLSQNTAQYSGFFAQEFPTGTSYAVSLAGFRQSTNSSAVVFNPETVAALSIGINQHLLNGFGYRANKKFIRIADNDIGISKDYFKEQVITAIAQIETDYWNLVEDKQNVLVAQEAVTYYNKLVSDNQKQVQIGTLAPLDVIQAQSQLATGRQNLIVARTTFQQQQEVIKTDISKQVTGELLTADIEPADALPMPGPHDVPSLDQALELAHANRPEVDLNGLNLKNEQIVLKANRNSLLPTLDAYASFQPASLSGNHLLFGPSINGFIGPVIGRSSGGIGQAFSQLVRGDYPSYSVGLTLQMPLRNRAAQADAARALLEQHMLRTQVQQTLNAIDLSVRQAEIAVVQGRARVDAAQKAADYAQQQYVDEQKKFRVGESTLTLVIQMQNNLTQAEGTVVQARAGYATALTQFQQATGTNLAANHVELVEALTGHVNRMPNIPGTPFIPANSHK